MGITHYYPYYSKFKWGNWSVYIDLSKDTSDLTFNIACDVVTERKEHHVMGTYIPSTDTILWTGKSTSRVVPRGLTNRILLRCRNLAKRYHNHNNLYTEANYDYL